MNKAEDYREPGSELGSYEPPQDSNTDIELQLEVRYASILQQKIRLELENDRIRNQMADITTRLEHLQESHDTIRDRLVETEDKLRAPQRDDDTAMFIKRLEDKIREQDELIESQEGQVDQDREEKTKMRKELDTLRKAAERTIQLEDELKELRLESIELAKKANTADRFKQKLEAQKALENDLKNVEYENEELRSMLRDFNKIKARNQSLEQTHLQFQNSIAKAEMEIFEIHSQKKHLDMQKAELESALEIAEARRAHDEQFIADLQEQIQSGSPERAGFSLEDELETEDATQKATSLEISRLRAEVAALKSNATTAQESSALRTQLEEAMAYRKVIEAKYRDAFEKEAISQQQLRLMMSSVEDNTKFVELAMSVGRLALLTPEYYRHQAFIDLKHAHGRLTDDLASLKKKYDSLNEDHQETQRELIEKSSDLSMVGKDELDKLAEFKLAQESLVASFEAELMALKSKNKALEIDYDLQKTHLQESILLNAKLRNTLEEDMKGKGDSKAAVDVSKPSRARRGLRSYRSRASVRIPERIRHARDHAKELVAERTIFSGSNSKRHTLTPPSSSPSESRSGRASGSSSISSSHSSEAPAPEALENQSLDLADIPLSPAPSAILLDSGHRRPSALQLPESMPATPKEVLHQIGLGRSLTAAFTGGRELGARASVTENGEGDHNASGTDKFTSHRDFFQDILHYGDTMINRSNEVSQEMKISKTIGLAITTDGLQDVSVEDGLDTAAIFAKSTECMDDYTARQLQLKLVEEASQRKLENSGFFPGRYFGKKE